MILNYKDIPQDDRLPENGCEGQLHFLMPDLSKGEVSGALHTFVKGKWHDLSAKIYTEKEVLQFLYDIAFAVEDGKILQSGDVQKWWNENK